MLEKAIIEDAIARNPHSMKTAAEHLGIPFGTFKYAAVKYGIWKPKQNVKNNPLRQGKQQTKEEFLKLIEGKKEFKGSGQAIRKRLVDFGFRHDICEECGQLPYHNNKELVLQLDHVDGNHYNWKLENLRILCPNCHTQTDTHSGRNRPTVNNKCINDVAEDTIIKQIQQHSFDSIAELARSLGLNPKSSSVCNKLRSLVETHLGV